jgi:hypothetical protein
MVALAPLDKEEVARQPRYVAESRIEADQIHRSVMFPQNS